MTTGADPGGVLEGQLTHSFLISKMWSLKITNFITSFLFEKNMYNNQ